MQLGVRQARYFGRAKTLFQLLMAATVANLTLVATRVGLMRDRNHPKTSISTRISALLAMLIAICRVFAVPSLDRRLWNYPWTWVFGHTSRCASAEMPSLLRRGVVWLLAYDGFLFHHLAQLFLGGGARCLAHGLAGPFGG